MTVSSPSLKPSKEVSLDAASFRNVSACKRCRLRKHKCDQSLPRCGPCEKAQARCVGYDPINKQEIPRSYVYFLESRVKYLDTLLLRNNIEAAPANTFDEPGAPVPDEVKGEPSPFSPGFSDNGTVENCAVSKNSRKADELLDERKALNVPAILSHAFDKAELETASPNIVPKLLSGVAVRHEILKGNESSSGFDSSFIRASLSTRLFGESKGEPNALPSQTEAEHLTATFFKFVNQYTPVLSQSQFQAIIRAVYCDAKQETTPFNLYLVNIVFAIGAVSKNSGLAHFDSRESGTGYTMSRTKRRKVSNTSCTPESYKDSAMIYLDSYLSASSPSGQLARLEELQAILLLCIFALLQPASLPLGNLIELAMRSATDLRLYSDYDTTAEFSARGPEHDERRAAFSGQGWIQELRRRLWWSVYSLERMVVPYMNRPFFIPDEVITAQFPSMRDEHCVTNDPSLKSGNITRHHLKLRCLQSEIHRMVQYQQASQIGKDDGTDRRMKAPSFLKRSSTFSSWRRDMMKRLSEWKMSMPTQIRDSAESFGLTMELEYWQSVLSLYRHSIPIPEGLLQHYYFETSVPRPKFEASEDINEVYSIMMNACQRVIQLYREIQFLGLPNVTYLATDWVFIAGTYFMFSIWESPRVVSRLSLHDLDSTSLMATALLQQYEHQYPVAKLFQVNFQHMSDETVNHFRKAKTARHGRSQPLTDQPLPISTNLNQVHHFEQTFLNPFHELGQESPGSWVSEGGFELASCSSDKSSLIPDVLSPFHGSPSLSEPVQHSESAPLIQSNTNPLDAFELAPSDWDFLNSDCWDLLDMSFPLKKESSYQLKDSRSEIPDGLEHLDGIVVGWANSELPKDSY